MKKLLFFVVLSFSIGVAAKAQDDDKDKVKKTSTPVQKVHNTVSRHKKYKGYKIKHHHNGNTAKRKVDLKDGDVKEKGDK